MPSESWQPAFVVNLDKVPKKYAGLDGTEIAISESQERMAVVVDPKDVDQFLKYAKEENLEAVEVAVVTEEPRLVLVLERKRDRKYFPCIPGYQRRSSGDRRVCGDSYQRRMPSSKRRRGSRCQGKMAGYAERSECVLPEGTGGDVRRLHRCRQRTDALRRKISADRDPGHGSKASGAERKDRHRYHDELWL